MTKAADIMTRQVVSATTDTPISEAARTMARLRITGMPVCDGDGHLVGVVSEYDLIASPESKTVGDVMTRSVVSVGPDTDIEDIRFLLVNNRIRRVPVLDGTRLVGVVSRSDLVRDLALSWICGVCGDHERSVEPPAVCPRCGTPSGYEPSFSPPVGEGADVAASTCPTCGQALPKR